MKELILIRHADAVFLHQGLPDFERPLSTAGKKNARQMAAELKKRHISVDCFIYSGAARTRETLQLLNSGDSRSRTHEKLYEGADSDYFEAVLSCDDHDNTVAIIGHNPGITQFVDDLLTSKPFYDMPPTGICSIKVYADSWQEIVTAKKELNFFIHPD